MYCALGVPLPYYLGMEIVLYFTRFSVAARNEHILAQGFCVVASVWRYIGCIYLW